MKELKDNKEFYYWLDSYNQCFLDNLIRGIRNTGEIDKENTLLLVWWKKITKRCKKMHSNLEKNASRL